MMQRICFVWTNGENVDAIGGISNTMKVSFYFIFFLVKEVLVVTRLYSDKVIK